MSELFAILDEADVRVYVDLDGGWGEEILHRHWIILKPPLPSVFAFLVELIGPNGQSMAIASVSGQPPVCANRPAVGLKG